MVANNHHPVYGCFIHVFFYLTKSTIVNNQLSLAPACPVRPADKRHLAEKKNKLLLKKETI